MDGNETLGEGLAGPREPAARYFPGQRSPEPLPPDVASTKGPAEPDRQPHGGICRSRGTATAKRAPEGYGAEVLLLDRDLLDCVHDLAGHGEGYLEADVLAEA